MLICSGGAKDFGSENIILEFTKHVVDGVKSHSYVRVDNGSSKTLNKMHCSVSAWQNGKQVNTGNLKYFRMVVDPGESMMNAAEFNPYRGTGFKDFDKLSLDTCSFYVSDREKMEITSGPVIVNLVELDESRLELNLSLTNNKSNAISDAGCIYDAKIGNVIVNTFGITFRGAINEDASYIEPGETIEKSARLNGLKSLKQFDATFDYENLDCSYKDSAKR